MKFDSNLAWKQASAAMKSNRELLLTLAGVFFLLPSLAFSLFVPQPEPSAGATEAQILAQAQDYYVAAFPYMLAMALIQAVGTMASLTLFTDRSRPTVGRAIRLGLGATPIYILAQLLLGLALGTGGTVVLLIGGLTGSKGLTAALILAIIVAAICIAVKTSLVAPIVAVEHERNAVSAIRRSWQLTHGNGVRLGAFYALFGFAALVIVAILMMIIGTVLGLAFGDETARIVAAVFSSALGAVLTLYFVAIIAAVHRQLAGPSSKEVAAPFD